MRQVPKYLLIGDGRVARHLARYFSLLKLKNVTRWDRAKPVSRLHALAADATHILLAINDGAIDAFIDEHLAHYDATKIHFSGSLVTKKAFGAHPLMTFGPKLYDLDKYRAIPFIVDSTAPGWKALFPQLKNPHERLNPAQKAKYHALCVMAGNFSCLLWQKLFDGLADEMGIAPGTADLYLLQQTENLLADYKTALTGPLARGDTGTINRNLKALDGDAFQPVYRAFVKAYTDKQNAAFREKKAS